MTARLPVAMPSIGPLEEGYARDALASSWVSSTGPYVDRFEREFASFCGTRACVSAVNGTAALHLALVALGLTPADEVIVPALTYVATANAVRYVGATPVFADVEATTWCLDPTAVERSITPRTRGLIAVHLYGHPADMDALHDVAARHGLWVVEDAAEAHGATCRGRAAGSLGDIGVFSFYGNKIVTSGEGGALTTDDPELEARIRLYRGQGMDPARRYWFPVIGFNYRLTNVACALLCAQLERFKEIWEARRRVFARYREHLSTIPGIGLQPVAPWATQAPWLFSVTFDPERFGCDRDVVGSRLDAAGIETRPFFHPLHRLPPYLAGATAPLPVTEGLAASGLNLPTYVGLTDADVDRVADEIWRLHREMRS